MNKKSFFKISGFGLLAVVLLSMPHCTPGHNSLGGSMYGWFAGIFDGASTYDLASLKGKKNVYSIVIVGSVRRISGRGVWSTGQEKDFGY